MIPLLGFLLMGGPDRIRPVSREQREHVLSALSVLSENEREHEPGHLTNFPAHAPAVSVVKAPGQL